MFVSILAIINSRTSLSHFSKFLCLSGLVSSWAVTPLILWGVARCTSIIVGAPSILLKYQNCPYAFLAFVMDV